MVRETCYELTLHLEDIHDLFTVPAGDPFSEKVRFVSGIEFIKSELKPELLRRGARIRTTIFLPRESLEPNLARKTKEALKRYCQFKIRQNKNSLAALERDALRALLVGVLFLACGLFFAEFLGEVSFLPRFLSTMLSDGFDIAFWVILWRPVDFFLFDLSAYWREARIYEHMMMMEVIVPEELHADAQWLESST
ncbi:MAG: hypothetical protein JOZ18_10355 [Chloroflexi bacterium]|nr:hypothetical protein [Chloroflexota bacterium]